MLSKTLVKTSAAFCFLSMATVSLGAQSAEAASRLKHRAPIGHRLYDFYPTNRLDRSVRRATLPDRAEFGFLNHIPSNAISMPGYTFVPAVGILGESCDLPTSACPNEDRDGQ
jgi:hypothetical protein